MTAFLIYLFLIHISPLPAPAQQGQNPYQIPNEIYVGDAGKLVYPLDEFFLNIRHGAALWNNEESDAHILNVEFDRSGKALIISFQAWRAGTLLLPPITLGGEVLSGLRVHISSVLAKDDVSLVLLPQEGPLNPPGTFWLLLLASLLFILGILVLLFAVVYGKSAYKSLLENTRLQMPRHHIKRRIKKYKRKLQKGKIDSSAYLSALCFEFRKFISRIHAVNCAALTAGEFRLLPVKGRERIAALLEDGDSLRFSGREVRQEAAFAFAARILAEVETQCAPASPPAAAG